LHVVGGFDLGNPDTGGAVGDGVEICGAQVVAGGVDPDPSGLLIDDRDAMVRAVALRSGGTASTRSRMTASAPAWKTFCRSLGLWPGAKR
jgi:hypothetical protein